MRQVVFLVHGMGNSANGVLGHSDMAWAKDAEQKVRAALPSFPSIAPEKLQIVPVLYDDVFRSHVTRWSELADSLVGTPLEALTGWMKGADKQDFLWGNLSDVVLYRAFAEVREHVLTHVARQFMVQIGKFGTEDTQYSVLAHSLGTAVAHDALQKLYTIGVDGKKPALQFQNFFALSNVSRLLWVNDDRFYRETVVRPFDSGLPANQCAVVTYTTFRHIADPIASIVRFTRKDWNRGGYASVELDFFREVNVHALTSYLAHPTVTSLILFRLFGQDVVPPAKIQALLAAFEPYAKDVLGAAKKLAVHEVARLLDGLSASSQGTFATDFDEVGKAMLVALEKGLLQ
jgi:hypothetical protein